MEREIDIKNSINVYSDIEMHDHLKTKFEELRQTTNLDSNNHVVGRVINQSQTLEEVYQHLGRWNWINQKFRASQKQDKLFSEEIGLLLQELEQWHQSHNRSINFDEFDPMGLNVAENYD